MPLVIKYGGNAMTDESVRRAVATTIRGIAAEGVEPIVAHGGGPVIARALEAAAIESRFVDGLRVTDESAMPHVEAALTLLGKRLAQEIGCAVALTGRDGSLLKAEVRDPALGRVGRMTQVDDGLLHRLLQAGVTPVIACLALDAAGEPLNVNADEVAGFIAGAMRAPVIFLTNVPGVLDDPARPDSLIRRLESDQVRERLADGRISGGMIPKVGAALAALEAGALSATIADGLTPWGLEGALKGEAGTRIVAES